MNKKQKVQAKLKQKEKSVIVCHVIYHRKIYGVATEEGGVG